MGNRTKQANEYEAASAITAPIKQQVDVAIVGGGASGMFAANLLVSKGLSVAVIEANDRLGKKLLATGGGRCNLSNITASSDKYNDPKFVAPALKKFDFEAVLEKFLSFGLLGKVEDGRVYPYSDSASTVVDVLRLRLEKEGVKVFTGCLAKSMSDQNITASKKDTKKRSQQEKGGKGIQAAVDLQSSTQTDAVEVQNDGFLITCESVKKIASESVAESVSETNTAVTNSAPQGENSASKRKRGADRGADKRSENNKKGESGANETFLIAAKAVVLATGSPAGGGTSSVGLYSSFGHTARPFTPSLVPLKAEKSDIKGLSGVRVKAAAHFLGKTEKGEVQFRDFGVSGIAIFNLAAAAARRTAKDVFKDALLKIDFLPDFDLKTAEQVIAGAGGLSGILKRPLAEAVAAEAKRIVGGRSAKALARAAKNFPVRITGLSDMSLAQVASGGLITKDFDPATMQSNLKRGLYAIGEALDIDGLCGGFNLHFAWASAMSASAAIGKSFEKHSEK